MTVMNQYRLRKSFLKRLPKTSKNFQTIKNVKYSKNISDHSRELFFLKKYQV